MKKILFLTPYLPSNRAGGENFTRLLLEELSKTCQIDLIYFKYRTDPFYIVPNSNIKVLKVMKNSSFIKLKNFILYPILHPIFSIRFDWFLLRYIKYLTTINQYDFLYLDHSQMFIYGMYVSSLKKILMSHDVMYQRFLRMRNPLNLMAIRYSEKRTLSVDKSVVFTFSKKDSDIIRKIYGKPSLVTIFFLDRNVINAMPYKIENQIVFFGKWNRKDNFDGLIWFFENVYSKITRKLNILIIGIGLPDSINLSITKNHNVTYLGYTNNPYPIIANSILLVSPLFSGAGVKVKVVEALACGTPVLGTEISFEGIDSCFKKFMLDAENAADFVKTINRLAIPLNERQKFKDEFLREYHNQSILGYIEAL